ncbi:MAG: NAD-dependent epimerase/dehydratase family protein, partial [Thermoguttaceae bacterium]
MKALVTGGSGFVGQYLLEQLIAEGCETRSLNRHPSPLLKKLGVEERLGSLDDFEVVEAAVRGCDVVFHIAAYPSVVMDPAPYYRTNILGARNIVAACLRQRVRKLVYTSTQCVANTIESQEGIDESVPYAPQFLGWYQMTKAVAE